MKTSGKEFLMFGEKGKLSPRAVREVLHQFARPGYALPLLILSSDIAGYIGFTWFAIVGDSLWLKLSASLLAGLAIGTLFVVGHDACHGSYTANARLNAWIGRIAFLPSMHAYSLWMLGHNRIHHRYTNLSTKDYVWKPYTFEEFGKLKWWSRMWERLYRTTLGHGFYYLVEIWWRKIIFPNRFQVPEKRPVHFVDCSVVVLFFVFQVCVLIGIAHAHAIPIWHALLFGWAVPFLAWNWLMGFIIYQHHTHPAVAWFDSEADWKFMESQVDGTPHIRFPKPLGWLLHCIMEHTAHHAMTSIPLYMLPKAQAAMEEAFGGHIRVIDWTWAGYRDALHHCKLYDYKRHIWQDFNGRDTTLPVVSHRPVEQAQ